MEVEVSGAEGFPCTMPEPACGTSADEELVAEVVVFELMGTDDDVELPAFGDGPFRADGPVGANPLPGDVGCPTPAEGLLVVSEPSGGPLGGAIGGAAAG